MKLYAYKQSRGISNVTPFVGVWIEIFLTIEGLTAAKVTPFVGVWIEILPKKQKT